MRRCGVKTIVEILLIVKYSYLNIRVNKKLCIGEPFFKLRIILISDTIVVCGIGQSFNSEKET